MNLREANYIQRRATIDAAVNEAATAILAISAARSGSTPDDTGAGGYFEEDEDGDVFYHGWFRAGDYPDTKLVRPY